MLDTLLLLSFIGIITTLSWAALIDLKTRILPNELMATFLFFGCLFHLTAHFQTLGYVDMLIGGLSALGVLLLIRTAANMYYKQDAFGLGDVKLLTAAGVFLGLENFVFAVTLGSFLGLLHGLCLAYNTKQQSGKWPALSSLTMPAGPGFVGGILIVGSLAYGPALHDAILQVLP